MSNEHPAQAPDAASSIEPLVRLASSKATDDTCVSQCATAEGLIAFLFGQDRPSLLLYSKSSLTYTAFSRSMEDYMVDLWIDDFDAAEVSSCDTDGLIYAIRSPTEHPEANLVLRSESRRDEAYVYLLKEPVWKRDLQQRAVPLSLELHNRVLRVPLTGDGEWEVVRASNARRWTLEEIGQATLCFYSYWPNDD